MGASIDSMNQHCRH